MASSTPIKVTTEQASALINATTVEIFNEHDQGKRRDLMKKYWSTDIVCFSPFGAAPGYDGLDQVWEGLHAETQKTWVFKKVGPMWVNFNVLMQEWTFGEPDGEPGMKGWDVLYVGEDGKVEKVYAMIEGMATHASD